MEKTERIVTTSWDDGNPLDEKLASLLLDYEIKGTFYVAKNSIEESSNDHLVTELGRNFEIGAHTMSHRVLPDLLAEEVMVETVESKKWLEKVSHRKVEMFCYPKGRYNSQIVELVKKAGFIGARTLNFDIGFPSNPHTLGVTCQASNGSPLLRLRAALKSEMSLKSILDWKTSSISLFDYMLENGGIWHLWGHSWEIEKNGEWQKLEDILKYVSHRENVCYLENRQIIRLMYRRGIFS